MPRSPLRRPVCCATLLLGMLSAAPARSSDTCNDIARSYQQAKPDITTVERNAALFAAADSGCDALARRLLDHGAGLRARDRLGPMPLEHAAREGRVKLVELFLASGAPIDARNVAGSTALFAAAEHE